MPVPLQRLQEVGVLGNQLRGVAGLVPVVLGGIETEISEKREVNMELAKQAAQCVERTMLDNDMFSVDGTTVSWKLRICGEKVGS